MGTFIVLLALGALIAAAWAVGEPTIVTGDLTLEAQAVLQSPLVIAADGVTIDGRGATIQGPGAPGDREHLAGVGVLAEGRQGVTIRNLKVRGFACGLMARDGQDWRIEGCDFSDNYHDPDFGWGDGQRNGGIVLTRISRSVVRDNCARRVWNGLDLWDCHENVIERNVFSHCSNVCLKLWCSRGNRVLDNDLSWGLRLAPGEVHARDSAGVLIETGSDDNRFERNDVTHGGDGVFIRPLNGLVSTGNVFVENDCSFANNNGFESWSPGNVFLRNRANHCSYGFWLGGSDHTVLIGNEAFCNGLPTGKHNAPERHFGHGGIVIVGGQGHHSVIDANRCRGNHGAGIVFFGDMAPGGPRWRMQNMVVQNNELEDNEWGLFICQTDGLFLAGNTFRGNRQDELLDGVTNLRRGQADPQGAGAPEVVLTGPGRMLQGQEALFDASASTDPLGRGLAFYWSIDGVAYDTPKVAHAFARPGFHRVCLTVSNGFLAATGFRDVYVLGLADELATEGQASQWDCQRSGAPGRPAGGARFADDASVVLSGRSSLRMEVEPLDGAHVAAIFPRTRDAGWNLSARTHLAFWLRWVNPNHEAFKEPNPVVRLHAGPAAFTYVPAEDGKPASLLARPPYAEARYGWLYVRIPLAGGEGWGRSEEAAPPSAPGQAGPPQSRPGLANVDYLAIEFTSTGQAPFTVYLDGLAFE